MMSMTDSKPYPLPKPRMRPQHSMHDVVWSASNHSACIKPKLSSSPSDKPPITKPKPHKPMHFKNQQFISITADINIEDDSSLRNVQHDGEDDKNNNLANLKHVDGKNTSSSGSVLSGNKGKDTSSGPRYSKPLPPIPNHPPVLASSDQDSTFTSDNQKSPSDKETFAVSMAPRKPPRLHSSSSDSQLGSNKDTTKSMSSTSVSTGSCDAVDGKNITCKPRNPPLPPKPTGLRRISRQGLQEPSSNSLSNVDSSETRNGENRIDSTCKKQNRSISLGENGTPPLVERKRKVHPSSSDPQLQTLSSQLNFLKPNNKQNTSNAGCTPPLPRKPVRKITPTVDQISDSCKNEVDGKESKIPVSKADSSRTSSDCAAEETKSPSSRKENDREQVNIPRSRPSSGQRRGPPLETILDVAPVQGPPRRTPPVPPKRPSLEGKRRSSPPPLPKAPRPVSVVRETGVKKRRYTRSQSVGDMCEASTVASSNKRDDDIYWEAYQHLDIAALSLASPKHSSGGDEEGGYEPPDRGAVKKFMLARQQKRLNEEDIEHKDDEKNHEKDSRKTRQLSATYSSSSDDSAHAYMESDSPKPGRKSNEKEPISPASTVSSGGSRNYVDAIPASRLGKHAKHVGSTSGKYEFKPFNDMDDEWSKPKVIDWEYESESEDSDVSYVDPDAIDEDELDEDEGDNENITEEPLYQMYQEAVFEKERTLSLKRKKKGSSSSAPPTSPGYFTLRCGTLRGGKLLWSQLPEVRNSGLLENVSAEQRKMQEAMFEVVSSEASYLKSLNLLVDHFLNSKVFSTDAVDSILDKHQVSELFSNIMEVVRVSERFLQDLRTRQRESVLVQSISDIITDHASNRFQAYVSYCSSQYKQDRVLSNLKKTNLKFAEALEKLERDPRVFGLTLQSFLVLPMQRVTRFPLLVDAIVRRCEPGHSEYYKTDAALKAVNQVVYKCNEGARNEERRDEMIQLGKIISFLKMNPIKLVTNDRWLLRRGPVQLLEYESKSTLTNTLRGRFKKYRVKPIYLFLFSDLLVVTKKKSETTYSVIDYANRNMIRVQETTSSARNALLLVLLENCEKKTKELNVRADNETDLTRWREAFVPVSPSTDDEKVYGSWDCPQVQALHNYQAQQSDELSLVPGDVVNVLRKLSDGWYEGERIRDGVCGWFPANHTMEIRNEHVRARNLHQRYRLLAASTAFLDKRKR